MSINPAADASSTIDSIKSVTIDTAKWLGHQVVAIKDFVFSAVAKVIQFVKPLFSTIAQHLGEVYDTAREWVITNKEVAVPVGIASVVMLFIGVALTNVFGSSEDAKKFA